MVAVPTDAPRAMFTAVVLDTIESTTQLTAADRVALETILNGDALLSLPPLSAAHIAGAWAVLGSQQTTYAEAERCQNEAARWVLSPFKG